MTAIGIDLGGTKIAAQVFDDDLQVIVSKRVPTPTCYTDLIDGLSDIVSWGDAVAERVLPVGIGAAGLLNPADRSLVAANHVGGDHPMPADLETVIGRPVTWLNDARAFTLSEAVFGAGKPFDRVASLLIGTGIGGGFCQGGALSPSPTGTLGEIGHISISAALCEQYGLPIMACGCGRRGCIETLISGPGIRRLGDLTQVHPAMSAEDIAAARTSDPNARAAWEIWCALVADLVRTIMFMTDPDCIILGGGVSQVPNLIEDLSSAAASAQIDGFTVPPFFLAEGGELSGARGAAFAALRAAI